MLIMIRILRGFKCSQNGACRKMMELRLENNTSLFQKLWGFFVNYDICSRHLDVAERTEQQSIYVARSTLLLTS